MPERTCSIEGCECPHLAKDLCSTHYERWRRSDGWHRTYQPRPPSCVIDGCMKWVHGRGLCEMHYRRLQRGQAMETPSRFGRPVSDRFWEKVDAAGDCWEWGGSHDRKGYGWFKADQRMKRAHRVAWELLVGPIPDDLVLDHLCINPPCVNPDHLEPVTGAENTRRALQGRKQKGI